MVFLVSLPALAGEPSFDQGLYLYRSGDYVGARKAWLPLADQGDARASFYISFLYAHGQGVAVNPRLAMAFLSLSAREGFAPAEYNLGNYYHAGQWVPKSDALAAHWWELAAAQNVPQAQHNLGALYLFGGSVPVDKEKARYWYRLAAANGSADAARMLKKLDRESPRVVSSKREKTVDLLGSDWIMRQPADKYTLQVLASQSDQTAKRLVAEYRFKRQVAVFHYKADGRWLYGMAYGRFDSIERAHAAVTELPTELRKSAPWARKFGDLQKIIQH